MGRAGVRGQGQGGWQQETRLPASKTSSREGLGPHSPTTPPGATERGPLTFRMRTVIKAMEKMIIILMNWL